MKFETLSVSAKGAVAQKSESERSGCCVGDIKSVSTAKQGCC